MKLVKRIGLPIILGSIVSWIFFIFSEYNLNEVFWGTWLFTSLFFLLLIYLIQKSEVTKFLTWVVGISLLLRLGLGLITTENLIDWGYDQEPYQSGYLFKDAYSRDNQAWDLAISDQPIWAAFSNDFFTDQYGGLLALSSLIYRLFTPDAHFQINIIFFVTMINVIGILFLALGLREKNKDIGFSPSSKIIILIFSFYPDAVLFSASQMREPILLGISACLFWIIHKQKIKIWNRFALFSLFSIFLLLISLKIGIFIIFSFLIWMLFQPYRKQIKVLNSKIIILPVVVIVIIALFFSSKWILEAGKWDALLLERNSGFVQYIVSIIGSRYRLLFASIYGLFQPVLPAALIEPSKLFWKILNSLRALGWYLMIPILVYGIVYFFRENEKFKKFEYLFIWSFSVFWIMLSSIRAGGDMWDNPRYRLSFLIFIAYIIGVAFYHGWKTKDHWLTRIFIAELVFVLFFLQWYISRYTGLFENLTFFQMVFVLSIIFGIILITGILKEVKIHKLINEIKKK
ncbi:MAG: hypothetical protein CVU40_00475 [Chloroflexi bacterium HGW-Chloroflexi-2]|jgi:hypothetical protein|nr:MAG: hypothetical protein CVU40_00475 [Chloroflexi bacterium HGW-Chloroflexi-2]